MRLLKVYEDKVHGAIKGLDRIRFRGTLRWLANVEGLRRYLSMSGILLKAFGAWAEAKTKHLRQNCERQAAALGIATQYLMAFATATCGRSWRHRRAGRSTRRRNSASRPRLRAA